MAPTEAADEEEAEEEEQEAERASKAREEEVAPREEAAEREAPGEAEEEEEVPDKDGWLRLMGGAIRKRVLAPGAGTEPEMNTDVICSLEVRRADGPPQEVLQRRDRARYRIGEGEAVPCLELCLRHMHPGEEAEVFGESRMAWGPLGLPAAAEGERAVPPDCDVLLRVVLHECLESEGSEPSWNKMVQDVIWRKESGNDLFRRKQFQKAARVYAKGLEVFSGGFEPPEGMANGQSASAMAMSIAMDIQSNLAAVHLELGNAVAARETATAALGMNPDHVKCLYRAARACLLLDEFVECEAALKRALELDPENAAVKRVEAELQRKKQRYANKSKRVAEGIFSALQYPQPPPPPSRAEDAEESGGVRAACRAALAWVRERRRYLALGAAVWILAALLCCVLPRRLWPYCIVAPMVCSPVLLAVVASREELDRPKKQS